MSVSTNDLKRGMTLDLDGTLYQIIEFQHVKPGKGGAFVRTKLRNLKTGGVVDRTFNAGVNVGLAIVERRDMQYLYRDGDDLVFMDTASYEQHHVPSGIVGDLAGYLTEGAMAVVTNWLGSRPGQVVGFAISAFFNIHHYFTDGVVWKLRDPAVRADLFGHLKA